MAEFRISSHPLNSATAITRLAGDVDAVHFDTVMDELEKLINSGILGLILDLSETTGVSCPVFGAFVHASRTLKSRNGKLIVSGPKETVMRFVEIIGLREMVEITETVEQARQLLSSLR